MKSLLKLIASYQERYIANIRQKKDASKLSGVAGVTLGGNIPVEAYGSLLSNIDGHMKEQRRFRADSTKIVLEKNSTLRALAGGNIFFFRHLEEVDNATYGIFTLAGKFKHWAKWEKKLWIILLFITVVFGGIICFLPGGRKDELLVTPTRALLWLILPSTIIFRAIINNYKYSKWYKSIKSNPSELLKGQVGSKGCFNADNDISVKVTVDIGNNKDLTSNVSKENKKESSTLWYSTCLKEMMVLATKVEGKIGWIWDYTEREVQDTYLFKVKSNGTIINSAEIVITNNSDNLLFFIETQFSFIFYFPINYKGFAGFESDFSNAEKDRVVQSFEKEKEKMFISFD